MKVHMQTFRAAGLAAMILGGSAALATSAPSVPSSLALPSPAVEAFSPNLALATTAGLAPEVAVQFTIPGHSRPAPSEVRYRHRRSRDWGRRVDAQSVSQIHAGFFDPDGDLGNRFVLGVRGGPMVDPNVQLGFGIDWVHKAENTTVVSSTGSGPGGQPIETELQLSRASSNYFPINAFVQVHAGDEDVIPYFGAGAGYGVMWLTAEDFQTGNSYDATFGGWNWQLWGGLGFPLSGRTRINGEVFVGGGELSRDVDDPLTGNGLREIVKVDGMGARFGLAWGF